MAPSPAPPSLEWVNDDALAVSRAADPARSDRAHVRCRTTGPDDTRALAARLADELTDGDLLVLTGDLGAGKTCFAQGLAAGLGIADRVTSPTFTLANRYRGRLTLHHLDVYRLDSLAETVDLGLGELLEDGVTVIEWGDRIDPVLPADHLVVAIRFADEADEADGAGWAGGADEGSDDLRLLDVGPAGDGPSRWDERPLDAVLAPWAVNS